MKAKQKKLVIHDDAKGVFFALQEAVKEHLRRTGGAKVTSPMGHRVFDHFVLMAAFQIFFSFLKTLLTPGRKTPAYLFSVNGVELGKIATSIALRHISSNLHPITFAIRYVTSLLRATFVLGAAIRSRKIVQAIFLGDIFYMDGIWVDYFLQRSGVTVYLDMYPFGLICVRENFKNVTDLRNYLEEEIASRKGKSLDEVETYMKSRLDNPRAVIDYYQVDSISGKKGLNPGKDVTNVVVYVHSFTDAQLERPFDGFKSVYDWLSFTLRSLASTGDMTKVYIKAHPNFFAETAHATASHAANLDKRLWEIMLKTVPNKFTVIDYPISNGAILRQFSPINTLLVSHHSNAVVEGAYLGFSSLTSLSSPWGSNYSFSTTWSSREEYSILLSRIKVPFQLSPEARQSARAFIADVYLGEFSTVSGRKNIWSLLAKHSDFDESHYLSRPFDALQLSAEAFSKVKEELISSLHKSLELTEQTSGL